MAGQAVVVSLPPEAALALREVARQEYRNPQGQAAWLVLEGLRQRGVLAAPLAEREGPPDATA